MSISTSLFTVLHNAQVINTLSAVVLITLTGYFLTLSGIFNKEFEQQLTKLILVLAVPALSFISFMQPLNPKLLHEGISVIVWGFLLYIGLLFLTPFAYPFIHSRNQKQVLGIISVFGSTTIFGLPIAGAIYGPKGIIFASLFNIAYRLLLYTYVYIAMAHQEIQRGTLRQVFLNPIVIATLLGLVCWLFQDWVPQITISGSSVAFYRIDLTVPWLYRTLKYLADLTAPLSWLIIGCTLGKLPFRAIILDKLAWYYAMIKTIIVPLTCYFVLWLTRYLHLMPISSIAIATIVLLMASPTSTIPVAYSISYHNSPQTTAKCSMISNITAILVLPFWIMVLNIFL